LTTGASSASIAAVLDLPETKGVFHACLPRRLSDGTQIGTDVGPGEDVSASIVLLDGGSVVARRGDREWTINSSPEQFRAALLLVDAARGASEAEWSDAEVDQVERDLRTIDSAAYDAENPYWASIIEQMRHQLL
jgi:hypothetical protein